MLAAGGVAALVVGVADLLGAPPGDFDLDVPLVRAHARDGGRCVGGRWVLGAGAQDVPDPVQRVVLAAPVAVDLLLDPAPDVDDLCRELHDVEGVQAPGVLRAGRRWRSCQPPERSRVATSTRAQTPTGPTMF